MIASCGCRVKSYRAKQCPYCDKWYCPPCYNEHVNSLKTHCKEYVPKLITLGGAHPVKIQIKDTYKIPWPKVDTLTRYTEYYGGKITAPKKVVLSDTIHEDLGLVAKKTAQMGNTESMVREILRARYLGLQDYLSNFVEEYEREVLEWLDQAILRAKIDILNEWLNNVEISMEDWFAARYALTEEQNALLRYKRTNQ